MKITLTITSLEAGGAERTCAFLANSWARKGHQVAIVRLADTPIFYRLDSRVTVWTLGFPGAGGNRFETIQNNIQLLRKLRESIRRQKSDLVISLLDRMNVRVLLATRGLDVPVIVCEHTDPAARNQSPVWEQLRVLTYGRAHRVVALTERARDFFPRSIRSRTVVIPNAIPAPELSDRDVVRYRQQTSWIVAMGRLIPIKGFDLLLRAFALIADDFPDWRVRIIGDGVERDALQSQAAALELQGRLEFTGLLENPFPALAAGDLFALTSRTEAFPMALLEAMACGLPAVCFDCPTGPREIIRDGIDGLLVPPQDVDALARGLASLMADNPRRTAMSTQARMVTERFGVDAILAQWDELLQSSAPERRRHMDESSASMPTAESVDADDWKYTFTVFTPTFNRADTLPRVYESLKAQTFRDFEWLVVDDGSTDNTPELVAEWQSEARFPIRFVRQPNQGKHVAQNRAVQEARGRFFLTFDSDDACVPHALEHFYYHWHTIPFEEQSRFSAVTALCQDQTGHLVGIPVPTDPLDSDSLELMYKYKVRGEKWGFQRTDVMRRFLMPVIPDSNAYIPESVIWSPISRKYRTRFVNDILRTYYVGHESISNPDRSASNFRKRFPGVILRYSQMLNDEIDYVTSDPVSFARAAAIYVRYSLHGNVSLEDQLGALTNVPARVLWLAALPVGTALFLRDRWKGRRAR